MKIYLVDHQYTEPDGAVVDTIPRGFTSELKAKRVFESYRRAIMDKWRNDKEWGTYTEYDDGGSSLFTCFDQSTHEEESVELLDIEVED